jgi:hypothetical protein
MKKLAFKTFRRHHCTMLHTTAYRDHNNFSRMYMHVHSVISGSKYVLTLNDKIQLAASQNPFIPEVAFTECFYK